MFQSELSLELDRILKSQLLNQTRSVSGPAEISVSGNPVESGFEVIAKEHDDSTRFPSDVLIDIKDMVKGVILKNVSPEKIAVKNLLVETKTILEKRQVSSEKFHINFDTLFDFITWLTAQDCLLSPYVFHFVFTSVQVAYMHFFSSFNRTVCHKSSNVFHSVFVCSWGFFFCYRTGFQESSDLLANLFLTSVFH